jgi:hypothetical protein
MCVQVSFMCVQVCVMCVQVCVMCVQVCVMCVQVVSVVLLSRRPFLLIHACVCRCQYVCVCVCMCCGGVVGAVEQKTLPVDTCICVQVSVMCVQVCVVCVHRDIYIHVCMHIM